MINLPYLFAKKYFWSRKKKNFIHVISIVSMVAISIATASLIIVLSVFNGLEGLLTSLLNDFDPQIKISAKVGKTFHIDSVESKLNNIPSVEVITPVIENNALIKYNNAQTLVTIKGVDDNFKSQGRIIGSIVRGDFNLKNNEVNYAVMGYGLFDDLQISLENDFKALQVFYPKEVKPGLINPDRAVKRKSILPSGAFAIEKHYDEKFMIVPLRFASDLFEYEKGQVTSIEIKTMEESDLNDVKEDIQQAIGPGFTVLTDREQHADILRAVKLEKLFVFIILSFILTVASINIFFSLNMLAVDKRRDISILFAMGSPDKLIRKIFLYEGFIISLGGAVTGIIIGFTLCYLQQEFGFISMGMQTAVVDSYPVKMYWGDFVATAITICAITFIISFLPARSAVKAADLKELQ
ncbi:FtsX-like permease family protein [Mangrovivirga sp. M17]|uniref:FtsX-like permease family protein n=1 Tax=Mangrovivirga halotolerans TaxID=2993936 RepID=A0ABT3RTD8_9BACT|nr:FtsX-like permease family protein [Mangrovivirga halotolerans]MCX2744756.1 FtsX-like permease family protein [Mangrovivirga halotolerans]